MTAKRIDNTYELDLFYNGEFEGFVVKNTETRRYVAQPILIAENKTAPDKKARLVASIRALADAIERDKEI